MGANSTEGLLPDERQAHNRLTQQAGEQGVLPYDLDYLRQLAGVPASEWPRVWRAISHLVPVEDPPTLAANGHDVSEPTPITKPAKATRGTRLPDDWQPDATNAAYARQLGMPDAAIRRETEKFRNYWHATSGQRGVKLDWSATWRNWCIRSIEDRLKDPNKNRSQFERACDLAARLNAEDAARKESEK